MKDLFIDDHLPNRLKECTNMTGKLTTHVLDTSIGKPAIGLLVELWKYHSPTEEFVKICEEKTNGQGRLNQPLLEGEALESGRYELLFHVAAYFDEMGIIQDNPPFLNVVPISFGIANKLEHYHVPLLIAPGGYSTYRGS
ncbi:hydroxyisourate hydrolase [Salipaludibacillus sp. HK11]|uniref:hydroxyisourate hydrolase n=1 Tax=Salipaludibacillus sp. HK11 TaxID=3394320 RepID=UPI0039FCDB65